MNRTGLIVALTIAVIVGLVFGLYPQLDLRISQPFHDVFDIKHNQFAWRLYAPLVTARDGGLWIPALLVAPAVASVLLKLALPRRKMFVSGSAALFLIATMALGPGLLVNFALKEHWSRPRPIDVTTMGGNQHFVAWWDPRGDCPNNCSFVSGDVSGMAWTFAPAALAPPQWRVIAYGGALAVTLAMAALRVMWGAHFFTDVVFAGVFTFLVIWLAYALIYRWPRTRLREDTVENALARFAIPGHDFIVGLFGGKKKPRP
jgi:membrane-associated PAP2 superfamily phosphatase